MTRELRVLCVALTALCCSAGCERVLPDIGWERMMDQSRGKAFRASPYFPDGKLMQAPPEGTVPATPARAPEELREGQHDNQYLTSLAVPVDRALLERGHDRFDLFCATCHGIDGSGESLVAHNMEVRKPPSLVEEPVRSFAPGRVFQVISVGYGLMPSYAAQLPVRDRWAVIGYLRALQRSRLSELARLPDALRRQAEEALQ
jgi:mono/diheme cytochrome c family protein